MSLSTHPSHSFRLIALFTTVAASAVFASTACLGVEIIAHRGASHLAPENTLASAELAWKLGADAVEIDIWLTKDGRIAAVGKTVEVPYRSPIIRKSSARRSPPDP